MCDLRARMLLLQTPWGSTAAALAAPDLEAAPSAFAVAAVAKASLCTGQLDVLLAVGSAPLAWAW